MAEGPQRVEILATVRGLMVGNCLRKDYSLKDCSPEDCLQGGC